MSTPAWPNGYLMSDAVDPLDDPVVQRDGARDLACILKEEVARLRDQRRLFCQLLDQVETAMAAIADDAPPAEQERLHHKLAGIKLVQDLATTHLRAEQ